MLLSVVLLGCPAGEPYTREERCGSLVSSDAGVGARHASWDVQDIPEPLHHAPLRGAQGCCIRPSDQDIQHNDRNDDTLRMDSCAAARKGLAPIGVSCHLWQGEGASSVM